MQCNKSPSIVLPQGRKLFSFPPRGGTKGGDTKIFNQYNISNH